MQLNLDRGYVMCPTGTGNLYIAGLRGADFALLEMTSEGAFVSSRVIDVGILGLDAISEMILDSDGNLVVTGNVKEDSPDNCFVFRYNPALGQTLWAKMFGANQSLALGVLENGPGGNFIVYTRRVFPNIDNAEFFQMNRTNGNIVPGTAWWYFDGSFHSMILHNGRLLAAGSWLDGTGTLSDANALMYINPSTGDPDWAYLERISPNTKARLYGRDLVAEGAAIISTFSGNDDGDNLSTSSIFLQKSAINGDLVWLKKIDLTEWSAEFAEEIISVPDGYVLYGRALSDDALFLLKTDKNGNLLWARRIKHALKNRILASAQGQLVALGNFLFATGYTVDASGDARMFILKTDECGMVGDSCSVLVPTGAIASDITAPDIHAVTPSVSFSATLPFNIPAAPPVNFATQKEIVCQEVVGNCPNFPDFVFEIDQIQCGGGGISLSYNLCNVGGTAVAGNVQVRFYPQDPTQNATSEIGSTLVFLNTPLQPGQCQSGVLSGINWLSPGTQELFSVVNHGGNLPTPFSFNDFPTTGLTECEYTNNLFGLNFSLPVSPVLDLGPDIVLCTDSAYVFDAGPGYLTYLWQDGSSANTFTAADPGLYWVEVTDECGFVQRDSVYLWFSLLSDTQFADTVICPGESVQYSLNGFTTYVWAPAAGLNCTTCPTVIATPQATTVYTLFATNADGCELRDTFEIAVRSIPVLDLGPDVILCTDTTIIFDAGPGFATYLWQDGTTAQTITAVDPGTYRVEVTDVCGGVQRDSVFFSFSLLPDTQFGDTVICPGESVTYSLNGFTTYAWAPAAGLNCTTCPTVIATPQASTEYTLFATNSDGCELRDTFEIAVRSIPVLDLGPDVILCTDTTIIFDAGPGFATYLWQDGTTVQTITAVDPGTYRVEVTDVCGGKQRDSVFFSFSLLPDTQFGDTVICPGESVTYSLNGFTTYAWAPAAGLNCTTCPTVTAAPQTTTTYTLFAYDNNGCELHDTFTVEVRGPANLVISCPANLTVQAAPGEQTAVVNYADPVTNTNCVCDAPVWTRTHGLASGAAFPIGTTQVCFSAEDGCNSSATCCFTITVEKGPDPQGPCDVKETPCVRFEILAIFQNPKKQKTYRMRVINKCANELMYVSYQLPDGITAKAPANASIYTTPAGRQYEVRNSAAHKSVRFKSIGPGIANGQSDIFEYTLPAQSDPTFIHATARLAPQIIVETHLNVFACVVQQLPANRPDEAAADRAGATVSEKTAALRIFPNPVTDRLQVDLSAWANQSVRLAVTDALGRVLLDERVWAEAQIHALELPQGWPSGVYSLTVTGMTGERATGRFVKR